MGKAVSNNDAPAVKGCRDYYLPASEAVREMKISDTMCKVCFGMSDSPGTYLLILWLRRACSSVLKRKKTDCWNVAPAVTHVRQEGLYRLHRLQIDCVRWPPEGIKKNRIH